MIQPTASIDMVQLEVTSQENLLSPRDIVSISHSQYTTSESSGINTPLSHSRLSPISGKVYIKGTPHTATQAVTPSKAQDPCRPLPRGLILLETHLSRLCQGGSAGSWRTSRAAQPGMIQCGKHETVSPCLTPGSQDLLTTYVSRWQHWERVARLEDPRV